MSKRKFKQQKDKEYLEKQKLEYEQKLKDATDKMLSLDCPFREGNCIENCVHFIKGHVYFHEKIMSFDSDSHWYLQRPMCRLWQ